MTEPNTELPPLAQPWATNIAPTVWAVQLTDDADWEAVAAWVGGTVESSRDATDEYQSCITVPREGGGSPQVAHEDCWVIRNEAGGRIVAEPTFVDATVVAEMRARQLAAELALFRERDALTRKALKAEGDGPLQFVALHVRQQRDRFMSIAGQRAMELGQIRGVLVGGDPKAELPGYEHVMTVDVARAIVGQRDEAREALEYATASYEKAKVERDEALAALAKQQAAMAKLDRAVDEEIGHRDVMEEWADKLAYAVAPVEVIGEHSNSNNPWENALEILERFGYVTAMPGGSAQ